ncbi:topoisomerase DNA-binding C4 zinc finger domain-containing protein [Paenibacillus chitinolyticus]
MVVRSGRNGKFYGCTNIPRCDNLAFSEVRLYGKGDFTYIFCRAT